MSLNIAIFALAAFFEIAGCFAFWLWMRRDAAPVVVMLGIASLIGFALALARGASDIRTSLSGTRIFPPRY